MREWCRKFKNKQTEVHDEEGRGRKSVAAEDIVQRVNGSFWSSINGTYPITRCYSPDFASSDFHLFFRLKNWLGGQGFQKREELQSSCSLLLSFLWTIGG
ncbi:hypothetical protein AVEN_237531-1 [Araneus ventricosus]|uniref:Mos1 transposase HTH domain-containing protein n=1 Tax=Araneus ventricosus TaxID=182803 RepID=A0A4Y1ZMA0_ARAVE|nr:hypothetical protein AVEN_237531-1 [Araneus ventricosus]